LLHAEIAPLIDLEAEGLRRRRVGPAHERFRLTTHSLFLTNRLTHHVMVGLNLAIKVMMKDTRFLLLDGPIKSGHDKIEFAGSAD
jgi:hypothetical protein